VNGSHDTSQRNIEHQIGHEASLEGELENGGIAIRIVDGHFAWDNMGKDATLSQINVTIPKGRFTALLIINTSRV
jgi:hypothetical protein